MTDGSVALQRPSAHARAHQELVVEAAFEHILKGFSALQSVLAEVTTPDKWLRVDELPFPKSTAIAEIHAGRLLARKVGRSWCVLRSDLDAFIRTHGAKYVAKKKSAEPVNEPPDDAAGIVKDVLSPKGLRLR